MAVGKGSLQRAASAAGKNTKAKTKTVKAGAQDEAVKLTGLEVQNEESEKSKETQGDAAENTEMTETQRDVAENTETKDTQREDTKAAPVKTRRRKSAKQQPDSAYLLTVPTEQLIEIPEAWQSGRQPRANVSALAESVSRCGILEPLPVVQTGEKQYQLVGGSKRIQVVQMLGIANVPVLVLPGSTKEEAQKLYQELKLETGTVKKQNQTLSLFGKQRIPEYLL